MKELFCNTHNFPTVDSVMYLDNVHKRILLFHCKSNHANASHCYVYTHFLTCCTYENTREGNIINADLIFIGEAKGGGCSGILEFLCEINVKINPKEV
jgi:hypothetical protein